MSETLKTLIESLLMTGVISAGFVWYALVAGRRESTNGQGLPRAERPQTTGARKFAEKQMVSRQDPDGHLGRCGAE